MKAIRLLLPIFVLLPGTIAAQSDTTDYISEKKLQYFNQINSGILFGKRFTGGVASVSTVHGVRMKRVSLGAGLGYENHIERELMPVFASIAFTFTAPEKNNSFFIEVYGGHSHAWHVPVNFDFYHYREFGGRMASAMLGYRLKAERFSMYFRAGYRGQRLKYEQFFPGNEYYTSSISREMDKLLVTIGLGFN